MSEIEEELQKEDRERKENLKKDNRKRKFTDSFGANTQSSQKQRRYSL